MIEPVSFEQVEPTKIRIGWKDGETTDHMARDLRLACPCASCVDEMTGRAILDPKTVPDDVAIEDTGLVGRYAFRFKFSDHHDTGIFTFVRLHAMGTAAG